MEIVDYTDKSFVVKGDKTKEYRENLKASGGKWNSSLKCGAGWIFPKDKKADLQKLVDKVNNGQLKALQPKEYTPKDSGLKASPFENRYSSSSNDVVQRKFYRDQREPEKTEIQSLEQLVEILEDNLITAVNQITSIKSRIRLLKQEKKVEEKKEEKEDEVEVDSSEVVFEEEIIEEEEVIPKKLIKK